MTAAGTAVAALDAAVAGLAPVSLEALVERAALLTRFDRKYLLPADDAARVTRGLDPRTHVLEIGGRRTFGYESVYFDTADHLAYRMTAQRRRHRFKVRTRSYLDTGTCFLEVKTKDGRGHTVKQRTECPPADRARLTSEGRDFVADVLCRRGYHLSVVDALCPAVTVHYRRATLLLPGGHRATIDTDLTWVGRDGTHAALVGYVVVESKSAARTGELDRALWHAGHRPARLSKFGTGTAVLHPDLPHHRWARTLAGPFADATHPDGPSHPDDPRHAPTTTTMHHEGRR